MFRSKLKLNNGLTAKRHLLSDRHLSSVAAACLTLHKPQNCFDARPEIIIAKNQLVVSVNVEKHALHLVMYRTCYLGTSFLQRVRNLNAIGEKLGKTVSVNFLINCCFAIVYNDVAYWSYGSAGETLLQALQAGRQPEIYALTGG
jgi:hypothetical protein